jgi:hypothetical protein
MLLTRILLASGFRSKPLKDPKGNIYYSDNKRVIPNILIVLNIEDTIFTLNDIMTFVEFLIGKIFIAIKNK